MKVVILAGGLGTRLAEETETKPKPMVEIGGRPILWHIMRYYAAQGFNEFLVALGYRGEYIKRFFLDYHSLGADLSVSLGTGAVVAHEAAREDWNVHLIETGDRTNTGGRVRRLAPWLDETFLLTYGDGVADVDLAALLAFHRSHGRKATVTAVRPPSRFGALRFADTGEVSFTEKPQMGEGWINGGFMVLEPSVVDRIGDDDTSFEGEVLEALAAEGELMAYPHEGFWQCVDTLRELRYLQHVWERGDAPWAPSATTPRSA